MENEHTFHQSMLPLVVKRVSQLPALCVVLLFLERSSSLLPAPRKESFGWGFRMLTNPWEELDSKTWSISDPHWLQCGIAAWAWQGLGWGTGLRAFLEVHGRSACCVFPTAPCCHPVLTGFMQILFTLSPLALQVAALSFPCMDSTLDFT